MRHCCFSLVIFPSSWIGILRQTVTLNLSPKNKRVPSFLENFNPSPKDGVCPCSEFGSAKAILVSLQEKTPTNQQHFTCFQMGLNTIWKKYILKAESTSTKTHFVMRPPGNPVLTGSWDKQVIHSNALAQCPRCLVTTLATPLPDRPCLHWDSWEVMPPSLTAAGIAKTYLGLQRKKPRRDSCRLSPPPTGPNWWRNRSWGLSEAPLSLTQTTPSPMQLLLEAGPIQNVAQDRAGGQRHHSPQHTLHDGMVLFRITQQFVIKVNFHASEPVKSCIKSCLGEGGIHQHPSCTPQGTSALPVPDLGIMWDLWSGAAQMPCFYAGFKMHKARLYYFFGMGHTWSILFLTLNYI